MQIKLLNEIVSEIAGKQASEILELLMGKKDVNEFVLAKKLNLTINQVRNILYKLSNFNLVTFTRKKDRRKGWYTYFWTLDIEKSLELLANQLKKEIENMGQVIKSRHEKRFYFCKTCKTEVGEENALMHNFTCQECGEIYELADNKKVVEEMEKNRDKLERQRQNVLDELIKIKEEKQKKARKQEKKAKKKKLRKKKKIKRKVKKKGKQKKKKSKKRRLEVRKKKKGRR